MAIALMDGFDLYNGTQAGIGVASKWTVSGGYVTTAPGRFGGQAVGSTNGGGNSQTGYVQRALPAPLATVGMGFALKHSSLSDANFLFLYAGGGATTMVYLARNADGSLDVYNGANVLLGTTAASKITVGGWHYYELSVTVSDTAGAVRLKIDGTVVLDLINVDTRNGTPTTIDMVRLWCALSAQGTLHWDDLYIVDTFDTLGERRIETLRPAADTVDKDFVASGGSVSNYTQVDDVLADAADYVEGSVVGDLDLYELANLSSAPAVIDVVQMIGFVTKSDAGTRNMALVTDLGGVQTQSADIALGASVTKNETIMAQAPGAVAWSAANVNNLRLGPKVTL